LTSCWAIAPASFRERWTLRQADAVTLKNLEVGTNGGVQVVDITVQAIREPETLHGLVLIVFTEVATAPETKELAPAQRHAASPARVTALEQDLDRTRQKYRITSEELQSFQQEASSAHEELQANHEEKQSAYEELTTSKEEMQSMNEELQTLNHELQVKLDDLSRINNDMKNLLDNTEAATVFLDATLCVRMFTAAAIRVFRLIPGDVGRPITDIASDLAYPDLAGDARNVLRTLVFHEHQAATRDGRWFTLRILPYRTLDDNIDGLVLTFADITPSKRVEADLRQSQAGLEKRVAEQDLKLATLIRD